MTEVGVGGAQCGGGDLPIGPSGRIDYCRGVIIALDTGLLESKCCEGALFVGTFGRGAPFCFCKGHAAFQYPFTPHLRQLDSRILWANGFRGRKSNR